MQRFLSWLADVFCGLAAYTLSRWIWQGKGVEVWDYLGQELATFSVIYVLLRLVFKAFELLRTKRKEDRAVLKAAAKLKK